MASECILYDNCIFSLVHCLFMTFFFIGLSNNKVTNCLSFTFFAVNSFFPVGCLHFYLGYDFIYTI